MILISRRIGTIPPSSTGGYRAYSVTNKNTLWLETVIVTTETYLSGKFWKLSCTTGTCRHTAIFVFIGQAKHLDKLHILCNGCS